MPTFANRNPYVDDAALTASPQRLLVMLYDRLALDLHRAQIAIEASNPSKAHDSLVHAQDIVFELRAALDLEIWPGGQRLSMLYDYILELLVEANVKKQAHIVATCRQLIAPIHDAWHEAAGLGVRAA